MTKTIVNVIGVILFYLLINSFNINIISQLFFLLAAIISVDKFCNWNFHSKHNHIVVEENMNEQFWDDVYKISEQEAIQLQLFLYKEGYNNEQVAQHMSKYTVI